MREFTSEETSGGDISRLPLTVRPNLELPLRFYCIYLFRAGASWLAESREGGACTVDNTPLGFSTAF
jgi:hypothetical protein